MPKKPKSPGEPTELRRRAERQMEERHAAPIPPAEADHRRLLHELDVHQIELEMQNAELRLARDEAESVLEKYAGLYDFAPVGYFTLAVDGTILLVNHAGAGFVAINRSKLVGRRFQFLIALDYRTEFGQFLEGIFASGIKGSIDSALVGDCPERKFVTIEACRSPDGGECLIAVTDITARKEAEEALRESEESFRVMANAMPQLAWIAQPDGHIFWYNERWFEYTGTTLEEMDGWGWQSVHDPDELPHVLKQWKAALETGVPFEMTFPLRGADGGFRSFLTRTVPLRNAAGKLLHWFGTNTDVQELKLAEERISISEIRYRRLFEAAHDGILILDPVTRKITDANPFMTTLLDYPRDYLIGKELFEIGMLKDEAASRAMFRNLKSQQECRYENLPLETKKGNVQEVEVVANLYQESGRSVIQCNIRDITARKHAEETLRRNEALFSALVSQAPVGMYVIDSGFHLQQANPTAMAIFGHISPLIGRDFAEIVHILWPKRVADETTARFRHTLKTGEPYQSPDFSERRKDIHVQEVYEWQIQRVTLPAGDYGVVCFFSNITARKKAETAQHRMDVLTASNLKLKQEIIHRRVVEEALHQTEQEQKKLLQQSRHQQEQLRGMSHQILHAQEEERKRISRELHDVIAQTLVAINVHLAALTHGNADMPKSLQQKISTTHRLVEKSVDIVHRFALELRPTVLDDLGLIPALHSHLKGFMADTGIRASLKAYAGIEKTSTTIRTALFRVAQESLTNVARHAGATHVTVGIENLKEVIVMKITDNGQGFDVDATATAKANNRLGMLGMRERIEMIGGTFCVDSAPGQPTTIHVEIKPTAPPPRKRAAKKSPDNSSLECS